MKSPFLGRCLIAVGLPCLLLFPLTAHAVDSATVKNLFAHPPRAYSSGPLWVWNDLLTEDQIVDTMRDLAGQQVKQVFVHPRPGLMTPYLSADWFRLWKTALREAERLDMNVWIYDENSYPSGFAGGLVPEAMPESRGRGLALREQKTTPKWETNLVAVYRLTDASFEDVSARVRAGDALPEDRYLVASVVRAANSPWHGGKSYVDLLYPGVTEKFLALTLDTYRREIGDQFGKRVPGVFTDEPNIRPAGGLPWTEDLPQAFEKRWGYRLTDKLPSLHLHLGDWQRVRHDYFQLLNELFIDRWAKPYHDYCAKNHLEFTGHYWEHEWPNCQGVPDNMAMYAWSQRPAIDILMNQYHEDVHAQFGNARAVRELSSVANQLGLSRTLCEAYGAGGWDLRFEDMKRIGDWLYVLGVNTLDQHLSYVTLRGARKRDHPQSFSYHEPWWEAYHVSASYFERLTAALTQGEQINPVLVLEPTTTAWMYNSDGASEPRLNDLGNHFQSLLLALERDQIEYDIGCEDILARHGSVAAVSATSPGESLALLSRRDKGASKGVLTIGKRHYGIVVVPPDMENFNSQTMTLLELFLRNGGTVLCAGSPPSLTDALPSDRALKASRLPGWQTVAVSALPAELSARQKQNGLRIQRAADDRGILFHHRRHLADGELLFLVNSSLDSASAGTIEAVAGSVEQWNLNSGKIAPYPFENRGPDLSTTYQLPPSGSLLLFLARERRAPVPALVEKTLTVQPVGAPELHRHGPNVLVLDFADITAGGETRQNLYFYRANQFAFQKNGMERNPWDSAVQFRDELITRKFPVTSGFEAAYRFTIEGPVPAALALVVERPDLYTVNCNGQQISATPGAWWLDKAFGRLDISKVARAGENVITLKAAPFTILHELEPLYVLGDFTLKAVDKGFVICPDAGVRLGKWNEQGQPFLSSGVSYVEKFAVPAPAGQFHVALPSWYGSVAKVVVNGKTAKYISCPPWECDVTSEIEPGTNTIEVLVIGTLKNTLGPHHAGSGLGSAWPGMFQQGPASGLPPGANYATVGYGLFEPFVLKQTSGHSAQ
jgi:hypothetical protein